jgi:hypothetical protein
MLYLLKQRLLTYLRMPLLGSQRRPTVQVPGVGEDMNLEKSEYEANGRQADARQTDAIARAPVIAPSGKTYAEAVRRRAQSPRRQVRFESKRRKIVAPLTLKQ